MTTPPPPVGPHGDPAAAPTRRLTPPRRPSSSSPVGPAGGPQYGHAGGYQAGTGGGPHLPPTSAYPAGLAGGPYAPPVPPPRRRRTGLVVGIIVGVAVLLGGAVGAYFLLAPKYVSKADLERNLVAATSGLATPAQSTTCPDSLLAEKDQRIDCTVRLADGTEVPARVTVTGLEDGQVNTYAEAAVIPKPDLEKLLSEDVARQFKKIAMTCNGDLAGVQGASTTCDGTDTEGAALHVKATFLMVTPELDVRTMFTPFLTADEVAGVVTATFATEGITITASCGNDDVLGEIGKTAKCTATDGSVTQDLTVTVDKIDKGYFINFAIT